MKSLLTVNHVLGLELKQLAEISDYDLEQITDVQNYRDFIESISVERWNLYSTDEISEISSENFIYHLKIAKRAYNYRNSDSEQKKDFIKSKTVGEFIKSTEKSLKQFDLDFIDQTADYNKTIKQYIRDHSDEVGYYDPDNYNIEYLEYNHEKYNDLVNSSALELCWNIDYKQKTNGGKNVI